MMGNIDDVPFVMEPWDERGALGTIGNVTTLPMTDTEREEAVSRPIGFIWPAAAGLE